MIVSKYPVPAGRNRQINGRNEEFQIYGLKKNKYKILPALDFGDVLKIDMLSITYQT